jgi:hypothetical protein
MVSLGPGRRDDPVAFSVQTFEEPYPAVMTRGSATVATAHDTATDEEIRAITRRYILPEDVEGVHCPLAGAAHHRHGRPGAPGVLVSRTLKPCPGPVWLEPRLPRDSPVRIAYASVREMIRSISYSWYRSTATAIQATNTT